MISLLAYGGFSGDVDKDMAIIISRIIPTIIILGVSVVGSYSLMLIIKTKIGFYISLISLAAILAFALPTLGVKGSYGPAHVATEIKAKIIMLNIVLILCTPFLVYVKKKKIKNNAKQNHKVDRICTKSVT